MAAKNEQGIANAQLRAIVERIERLDEEAAAISSDKADIYKEAKSNGFDTKALKEVIRDRRRDPSERDELEQLIDLYKSALGMGHADTGTNGALAGVRVPAGTRDRETAQRVTPAPAVVAATSAGRVPDMSPAPTPIRAAAEIDTTIPTFLRRAPVSA